MGTGKRVPLPSLEEVGQNRRQRTLTWAKAEPGGCKPTSVDDFVRRGIHGVGDEGDDDVVASESATATRLGALRLHRDTSEEVLLMETCRSSSRRDRWPRRAMMLAFDLDTRKQTAMVVLARVGADYLL